MTNSKQTIFFVSSVNSKRGASKPAPVARNPRVSRLPPIPVYTSVTPKAALLSKLKPLFLVEKLKAGRLSLPSAEPTTEVAFRGGRPFKFIYPVLNTPRSTSIVSSGIPILIQPFKRSLATTRYIPAARKQRKSVVSCLIPRPRSVKAATTHEEVNCVVGAKTESSSKLKPLLLVEKLKTGRLCRPFSEPIADSFVAATALDCKSDNHPVSLSGPPATSLKSATKVLPVCRAHSRIPILVNRFRASLAAGTRIPPARNELKSYSKIPRPTSSRPHICPLLAVSPQPLVISGGCEAAINVESLQAPNKGADMDIDISLGVMGMYSPGSPSSGSSSASSDMSFALSDITGITAPSSGDASPFRPSEVKRVCELSSPSPLTSASSVDLCAARPGSTRDMVDCSRSSEPDASTARSMLALRAPAIVMSQSDVVRIQERRLTTPASSSLAMTLPASTDLSRLPTLATFGPTSYALAFRRGTSGSPSVPSMRLRKFWVPPIADDAVVSSNPKIQMEISALRSQRRVAGGGVASLGGGRLNSLAGLAIVSKVRAQWEHSS